MKINKRDTSRDKMIVFSSDGTAAIANVTDANHERVAASSLHDSFSVPVGDLKSYTGEEGRIYLYASSVENVQDCKRIAELEKSTVLRQITNYKEDAEEKTTDLMKVFLIIGIVVLGIVAAVT